MKVFNIKANSYCYSSKYCVVAENMAEAERIFLAKYWPITIELIELHSEYVQVQGYDEQVKETGR